MAFRHGMRRLELIPFEAGTTKSIPLPKDRNIKRINLNFIATLVVTDPGGGVAGTVLEDSVLRLIRKIEVVADGVTTLFRATGRDLYYRNYFEYGTAPLLTVAPNGNASAGETIATNLDINFQNNIGIVPADTFLPSYRFRTLELVITWGNPSDQFSATHTMVDTISSSFGIRPVVDETTQPQNISLIRFQDYTEKQITATTSEFTIDIPVGAKVYQSMFFRTCDAGVRESDIINFINVITGENFRHISNLPFVQLLNQNKKDFRLETSPAGIVYLPLLEDGRIPSGLAVNDVNTAQVKLDVTVGGGTTTVTMGYDYIAAL